LLESRAKTKVANANAIVAAAVKSLGDAIRVPTTKTIAIAQINSFLGCKFIFSPHLQNRHQLLALGLFLPGG
jgi:hypothetical protein